MEKSTPNRFIGFGAHSLHKISNLYSDWLVPIDQICEQNLGFLNLSSPDEHSHLDS